MSSSGVAHAHKSAEIPCLILIGLTGVGKSLSLDWLERNANAERVRRYTTRRTRDDDVSGLVVNVGTIVAVASDFVYEGWGTTRYCIKKADVTRIRKQGKMPLIELGAPDHAQVCGQKFAPAKIVWLQRDLTPAQTEEVLRTRGVSSDDLQLRLNTLAEDRFELEASSTSYDTVIHNIGTTEDLFHKCRLVVRDLRVRPAVES
jgi:guanylate kinase